MYSATKATKSPASWETWDSTCQELPVGSSIYPYWLNITSAGFTNAFTKQGNVEVIR